MMELKRVADVGVERPMGSRAAREMLALRFDTVAAPSQARMAIDDLTKLHSEKPLNVFCKAMERIHPHRKQTLASERLVCNQLPLIRLRIESEASLTHAEKFFERDFKRDIELFLHIRMPQPIVIGAPYEDTSDKMCEYLSRLAGVLEKIQSATSHVRLVMVELVFGAFVFDDDSVTRTASRVCALALGNTPVTKRLKVTLLVARTGPKRPHHSASLSAWGELLQNICRVSCEDQDEEPTKQPVVVNDNYGGDDERDCNSLHVKFSGSSDTRLIAAFWSAVAFSRGFSSLYVDEFDVAPDPSVEGNQLRAKYAALALTSSRSSVSRLSWLKCELSAYEVDAMEQIRDAVRSKTQSSEGLATVLWSREWNLSREGHVFQVETLNLSILEAHATVLHDPSEREWIDVMVPGFGQCSIKRQQWSLLNIRPPNEILRRKSPVLQDLQLQVKAHLKATVLQLTRLIPIVGSTLTNLDLQTWNKAIKADGLLAILTSCPLLLALTAAIKVSKKAVDIIPSHITARNLKWLRIHFAPLSNDRNMESFLCELLPVIGSHLEELEIDEPVRYITCPRVLQVIMNACVHVKQLTLHHLDVGNLDPVIEAYREQRTALISLHLTNCRLDPSTMAHFATFLAYSTAQKLENFRFDYSRDDQAQPVVDKTALLEFLSMLQANKTLRVLHLSLSAHQHYLDQFKKHFYALDGRNLPVKAAALPLEATLALLSALRRKQFTQDPDIVRLILGFAASRAKRVVILDIDG